MQRDRHGRARHVDIDQRRRPPPGFRVRDGRRFGALVDEARALLPGALGRAAARADIVVRDVGDGERARDDNAGVALAFLSEPADDGASGSAGRPHIVVLRRPLELRAADRDDLVDLLRVAIGHAIGPSLGLDGDDVDDLLDED